MCIQGTSLDNFHPTARAQRADELARVYIDAVNAEDDAALDSVLVRTVLSYTHEGVQSRTATKKYYADLRNSFSELHFQVHENIGVLVDNDLVALRTIVTGVHTGDYADVPATGRQIQTSVSHAKAVDARSDNCNRCPRRRSHRPRPPKTTSGAELTAIALPRST
jgi:predicted ester cyclase